MFGPRIPSIWTQDPQRLAPWSPAFGPHSVWSTGVLSAWSQGPQCLVLRVPSVWSSGSPVFVPRVPSICSQGPQCLVPKALSVWSPGSPVFGPQGSPIFGFGGGGGGANASSPIIWQYLAQRFNDSLLHFTQRATTTWMWWSISYKMELTSMPRTKVASFHCTMQHHMG